MVSASAECAADDVDASRAILDPANLPRWFRGAYHVEASPDYPAIRSTIRWLYGKTGMRFQSHIVANELPHRLIQDVRTPSATSRITHEFTRIEAGRCRYTKTVDPASKNRFHRLLLRVFLKGAVKREVKRAAALLEAPPPQT